MTLSSHTSLRVSKTASAPSLEGGRRRAHSAPSMHDLPSVCDLVRDAYNKNKVLRENPQRPLHRTLLQRQLWSKLQQTFRETPDTSTLAHRPALTESDLGSRKGGDSVFEEEEEELEEQSRHIPGPGLGGPAAPRAARSRSRSSSSSTSSAAASSASASRSQSPSTTKDKGNSLATRLKAATFPGRRHAGRHSIAAQPTPPPKPASAVNAARRESLTGRARRSSPGHVNVGTPTDAGAAPKAKAALPAATAQASHKSFNPFRRSTSSGKSRGESVVSGSSQVASSSSSKASLAARPARPVGRSDAQQARLRALI